MKRLSKSDNERLHRYCETGSGDTLSARKFAGDVSRLVQEQSRQIRKLQRELKLLKQVKENK